MSYDNLQAIERIIAVFTGLSILFVLIAWTYLLISHRRQRSRLRRVTEELEKEWGVFIKQIERK